MNTPLTQNSASPRNPLRKVALVAIASLVVAAGLGWAAYEWQVASHYESTDNAYVQGNISQITPLMSGTVTAILADDNDFVKAGQALIRLDPADAKIKLDAARANLAQTVRQVQAQAPLLSNRTLTNDARLESHPSVQAASAQFREAWLATQRTALPAPIDGYVARRTVQLGQRVAAGAPLMSIVALNQVWVDANFKEVQLRHIRIGQPVKLTADLYGKEVTYQGVVGGLGMGTGAAFALLPAQNATGNWIKVVQRVPVRVTLDAAQLAKNPLRLGLSMQATVDVTRQDGKALADAPRAEALLETTVFAALDLGAAEEARRVVAANQGPAK